MEAATRVICQPPKRLAASKYGARGAVPQRRVHVLAKHISPRDSEKHSTGPLQHLQAAASRVMAGAAAVTLSLSLVAGPPPAAEAVSVLRFPASDNQEIAEAQQDLIQAWDIVGQTFFDAGMNGTDWTAELTKGLSQAYTATDGDAAYEAITAMLSDLGDPYTRFARAEDVENFRMSTEGELQGVGMLVASSEGKVTVVAPIRGSPAERAGIQPGDQLVSVNGKSIDGYNVQQVADLLRGKAGTSVAVRLNRRSSGMPGVAARPEPAMVTRQVRMRREAVQLQSVYSELVSYDESEDKVGYISIRNFSQHVARDTATAIQDLQSEGATSYILDLRDNGGGLVQAGLDVARLWLDGPQTILHIHGRTAESIQDVSLEEGSSMTNSPLAVLVNKNSASASEILAGALHDNGRAVIIGNSSTFGKGKIQSVYDLQDGSALFVTVAKYTTPNDHEIDHVGIRPDRTCGSPTVQEAAAQTDYAAILSAEVSDDACVQSAQQYLATTHHKEA